MHFFEVFLLFYLLIDEWQAHKWAWVYNYCTVIVMVHLHLYIIIVSFTCSWMWFNGVNNKERSCSPVSQWCWCWHMCRNSRFSWIVAWRIYWRCFCSGSSSPRQFPSHPFSLPLSSISKVWQVPVPLAAWELMAGSLGFASHGRKQSSSRSWLPIVEAPGCLRHPTSIQWCSCQFFVSNLNAEPSCSKNV